MALLNIQFLILIIKVAICVLPGVLAIFLLASNEESRRSMRNAFCSKVFGVSNAILFPKFERTLIILSCMTIVYSLVATWFLLLRRYF